MANSPNSAERILSTPDASSGIRKWIWQRNEKYKRRNWMITCGLSAIPVIFAYSGMALNHQDQPAKEMTKISGLPSSDSGHLPADTNGNLSMEDDALMARLDQTWEKIVEPILKGLIVIDGVDKLKITGWSILSSLTSISTQNEKQDWNLDDILDKRYLNGSVFGIEKDIPVVEMMAFIEDDSLKANKIPSWGHKWVSTNFDKMLELFDLALKGVRGIDNIESLQWIKNENGDLIIPKKLETVWVNLLKAISMSEIAQNDNISISENCRLIMDFLTRLWNLDIEHYLPVGMFYEDGKCVQDLQTTKLSLFKRLLTSTIENLGVGPMNMVEYQPNKSASSSKDSDRSSSNMITNLINMLLASIPTHSKLEVINQEIYRGIWSAVIDVSTVQNLSLLLHELISLNDDLESLQLHIWRCLTKKWIEDKDGNTSVEPFVTLLNCPFKDKAITSVWHLEPKESDLQLWTNLAKSAVGLSKSVESGSNEAVLDTVAAELERSFESHLKTGSSTISLSCLVSLMRLVDHSASATVPKKLLSLVSQALVESYPTPASLSSDPHYTSSPAIQQLVEIVTDAINSTSTMKLDNLIDSLKSGICIWMADDAHITNTTLGATLDNLYCNLLSRLSESIAAGHIPRSTEILDDLLDIFGPRLSRALSPSVPKAFQSFWGKCFQDQILEYSEDVKGFLLDVLAAVPGMIKVQGMIVEDIMSEEESQKKFPHSLQLGSPLEIRVSQQASKDLSALDKTEEESNMKDIVSELFPEITSMDIDENDKDNMEMQQEDIGGIDHNQPLPIDAKVDSSPNPSEVDSERVEEEIDTNDVFGPPALVTDQRKKERGSRKRQLGPTRSAPDISKRQKVLESSSTSSNSLPTHKELVPPTQEDEVEEFESSEDHLDATKTSILNSAGRWLAKASSFAFFSPNRTTSDLPTMEVEAPTASSKFSSLKKRHGKDKESDSKYTPTSEKTKRRRTEHGIQKDSKRRKRDSESSRSSRSRSSSIVNDISNPIEIDDGSEDELLLSPETARLRRQEEDTEIKQRSVVVNLPGNQLMNRAAKWASNTTSSASKSNSNSVGGGNSKSKELPFTQGRFDDAPEDHQLDLKRQSEHLFPSGGHQKEVFIPQPSPSRTSQQARVLAMIEEAASNTALIANMDYDGLMRVMSSMDTIRDALTGNLHERALRERKGRR